VAATEEKDKAKEEQSICPVTKIKDNSKCGDCHLVVVDQGKPRWGLKEFDPHKQFNYPCMNFRFDEENGQRIARLLLSEISSYEIERSFVYLQSHPEVKKFIIELQNTGGSMFAMWRIIGLMDAYKAKGNVIETRCHGFAASAAFILFVNGTKGYRLASPEALFMWHEVMSFSFLEIKTPSSTEDEAAVMRKFQNTAHCWLAARAKVSKEKIDENVRKREWWLTGAEMIEFGFADGLIK
jgi:ATP-dependent protease ClpP protease subunit